MQRTSSDNGAQHTVSHVSIDTGVMNELGRTKGYFTGGGTEKLRLGKLAKSTKPSIRMSTKSGRVGDAGGVEWKSYLGTNAI